MCYDISNKHCATSLAYYPMNKPKKQTKNIVRHAKGEQVATRENGVFVFSATPKGRDTYRLLKFGRFAQ